MPCVNNVKSSSRNDGGVDDVGGDSDVCVGGDVDVDGQEQDTDCQG
jgi:hypothetical protein